MKAQSVASNTALLVAGAIVQKIVVFVVNQATLNYAAPELVGEASIQFELLLSTFLFLSRESIRLACLRFNSTEPQTTASNYQSVVNMSFIPTIVTTIAGIVLASWSIFMQHSSFRSKVAVLMYCFATIIENISEPFYNIYNMHGYVQARVKSETAGLGIRSVVVFLLIRFSTAGIVAYGIGQLAFGVVYLLSMTLFLQPFKNAFSTINNMTVASFLPKQFRDEKDKLTWLDPKLTATSWAMFSSCFIKHLLTEADKITLTLTCSTYEQGIYAASSNYGSLVARILFLPLEDAARLSFSQIPTIPERKLLLHRMLKVVLTISTAIVVFGPNYVRLLTTFALRSEWDKEAVAQALIYYCYYLLLLGLNGIIEAFLQMSLPQNRYQVVNYGLAVSSAVFAMVVALFVQTYGGSAIILANIAAYTVRIGWSVWCVEIVCAAETEHHKSGGQSSINKLFEFVKEILPNLTWCFAAIMCKLSVAYSEAYFFPAAMQSSKNGGYHLIIGVCVGLVYLIVTYISCTKEEKEFIVGVIRRRK